METNKPTNSKLDLAIAVVVVCAVVLLFVQVARGVTSGPTTRANVECNEDEPCWDCETMGNRICGPQQDLPRTTDCLSGWSTNPSGVTRTEAEAECFELSLTETN